MKKKKILVVDDDPALRDLYKDIISFHFPTLSIIMGIDGEDGWREFQESHPDIVITDMRMETKDAGCQLAKKIKAISNVPIILFSATADPYGEEIDYKLQKPVGVEEFKQAIKKLL